MERKLCELCFQSSKEKKSIDELKYWSSTFDNRSRSRRRHSCPFNVCFRMNVWEARAQRDFCLSFGLILNELKLNWVKPMNSHKLNDRTSKEGKKIRLVIFPLTLWYALVRIHKLLIPQLSAQELQTNFINSECDLVNSIEVNHLFRFDLERQISLRKKKKVHPIFCLW